MPLSRYIPDLDDRTQQDPSQLGEAVKRVENDVMQPGFHIFHAGKEGKSQKLTPSSHKCTYHNVSQ